MEVGEKDQRLRALVAFEEGPGLVPITHIGSKPSLILVLGNPIPFSDPPPNRQQAYMWYTEANTHKLN